MNTQLRMRPWQLAAASVAGGAVGALVLALLMPAPLESQMDGAIPSFAGLAQRVMPAVVNINTTKTVVLRGPRRPFPRGMDPFEQFFGEDFWEQFGGRRGATRQRSLGSGFVVDDSGYIITNRHVVAGADDIDVQFADGRNFKAKLVGHDAKTDVALLKISPDRRLPSVPLGDSDELQIGDWVIAVGNPFGLEHTVTAGIVSARDRVIGAGPYDDFIQTDASINPGNSGGPLFDQRGRVVGIATAIFSQSGGNIGIGFAIPINLAKAIVDQLRVSGRVVRGWLGVAIQPIDPDLRQALRLGDRDGALIADVVAGSPAADAGLRRGDVVIEVDGKPVIQPAALSREIAMMPPGSKVEIRVLRDGRERTLKARIEKLPEDRAAEPEARAAAPRDPRDPSGSSIDRLGLRLETLSNAARRQLGYPPQVKGALVVGIARGSAAEKAGLQPGDVILQVDRQEIGSAQEAARAIAASDPPVLLLVKRGEGAMFMTLTPPSG